MSLKVQLVLLLQFLSMVSSDCPKRPGCIHTRLHFCCYFAGLNMFPHIVNNTTQYLFLEKDNITKLSYNDLKSKELLNLVTLSLIETHTKNLEPGAFRNIKNLRRLILTNNELLNILPFTFHGLELLYYLDLSYNRIKNVSPKGFYGLRLIKKLNMNGNQLSSLSKDTFAGIQPRNLTYKQLIASSIQTGREITFAENIITNIKSNAFQYLTEFTKLQVGGDDLTLPLPVLERNIFRNMKRLQILDLNYVRVTSTGIFNGLGSLVTLHMTAIIIHTIEKETFNDLVNLKELDISHFNNNLEMKDGAFRKLCSLISLRLDVLGIQTISRRVFTGLSRLQVLKLTRQKISVIQDEVFSELCNLVELDLEDNNIETINERSFAGLVKLRKLNMNSNPLTNIGSDTWNKIFIVIPLITSLRIDTKLAIKDSDLFRYLPSLNELIIEGNITKELVQHAENLKIEHLKIESSLAKIDIDYFRNFQEMCTLEVEFSAVKFIRPGEFCPLSNLIKVGIKFGHLETLQPGTFYGLRKLKELSLVRNFKLSEIPEGVFGTVSSDMHAALKKENITPTCETPEGLVALEILILSYSNISYIHPNAFRGNINLKQLDLSYNRIKTLSYEVELRETVYEVRSVLRHLRNLENLSLYRNLLGEPTAMNFKNLNLKKLSLALNPLLCNCKRKEFWLWMEKSHINLDITPWCKDRPEDWRDILTSLNCSNKQVPRPHRRMQDDEDGIILQQYVAPVVLTMIMLIGALGNILLLIVFILNPNMRIGSNIYILNLTIADILNLVVNLPLSYVDNATRTWELGMFVCQMFIFMKDFSVGLSVYSVVCLSLHRYFVIVHSMKHREGKFGFSENGKPYQHIVIVWIVAGILSLPSWLSAALQGSKCLNTLPEYGEDYKRIAWTTHIFTYCVLPFIIIMFLYLKTALFLKQSAKNMPGVMKNSERVKERIKLAGMVVALTVVFCVSYFPNFSVRVIVAWTELNLNSPAMLYSSFVSYCLFFSNTCFNPIALYLMSSKYRDLMKKYLTFWHSSNLFSTKSLYKPLTEGTQEDIDYTDLSDK